eukprot:gene22057-29122_t
MSALGGAHWLLARQKRRFHLRQRHHLAYWSVALPYTLMALRCVLSRSQLLLAPTQQALATRMSFTTAATQNKASAAATAEAQDMSGFTNADIDDSLLSRLKDPSLLHSAGLIGGKWLRATNSETYVVRNPATGKALATMPKMKAGETKAAIAAADSVFPKWSKSTAKERCVILRRWYDEINKHTDDLATIMTMEGGKPLAEAKGEIASGAASVEWYAEEGRRVCGDMLETINRDRRMMTIKQPVGVVGAITPWNFPMSMITRKVAPALAAGCTVVLKPSELTPLTAVALAELAERAGVPDGVINIVMGDAPAIGHELMTNEVVRKIGFTGSTAVGKLLMAGAAQTVKRVSLELGGNAPFIVFEDADLELAAKGAVSSALRNAGQTCICANRVFVHDASACDRVAVQVADAVSKGATVLTGGGMPSLPAPYDAGTFFSPTVLTNATIDMRCFSEETFGPLLPLFRFSSDDEAVMMANQTEYGLAAYFYTNNLARAWRLNPVAGMVGINEAAITSEVAPFGGVKQSGLGRENSKYGLDEFLEIKYICMGLGIIRGSYLRGNRLQLLFFYALLKSCPVRE